MTQPIDPTQLKVTIEHLKGVSQSNDRQTHDFSDTPQTEFTSLYDGLIRKHGYSKDKARAAVRACVILSQVINELKIDQRLNTSEDALHSAALVRRVVTLMDDTAQTETLRRQLTTYHLALNGAEPELLQTHLAVIEHPIRHPAPDSPFADAHVQIQNDFTPTPLKTTQPYNGYTLETNRINALQDALAQQAYTTKQTELATQQLARATELRDLCTQPLPTLLVTMDDNPCLNNALSAEKANNTDIQQTTQADTQPHSSEDDMNLKQLTATTLMAGAVMTSSACDPKALIQPTHNSAGQKIITGPEFDITPNPNPQQAYKLKVKLKDVPAPGFKKWNAYVYFDIPNIKDCGYYIGGAYQDIVPGIERAIDFPLKQISADEFEGTFYTDWGQDGDFFGKGVCHWRFRTVSASFRATGADGETWFSLGFESQTKSDEMFAPNKPLTRVFRKKVYPISPFMKNQNETGVSPEEIKEIESRIGKSLDPNEHFVITITAEELH